MTTEERNKIREAKNAYRRKWYKANPDKVQAIQERYWLKKAEALKAKEAENGKDGE